MNLYFYHLIWGLSIFTLFFCAWCVKTNRPAEVSFPWWCRDCASSECCTFGLCVLISAGLHFPVAAPTIFTRSHASISLTTLSPFLPPPLASFPFLSWHWAALWPEGSKRDWGREDRRKKSTGRREETWKEGARGREGWEKERNCQRVEQWSGCSCYRQGKGERSAKTTNKRKWGGNQDGARALRSFFLPRFIHFSTNCSHTHNNIHIFQTAQKIWLKTEKLHIKEQVTFSMFHSLTHACLTLHSVPGVSIYDNKKNKRFDRYCSMFYSTDKAPGCRRWKLQMDSRQSWWTRYK